MTTTDGDLHADEIDEQFVPRPRRGVSFVEVDDELVIAAPADGGHFDAHWLDRTAAVVWRTLDGSTTLEGLIDELSDAFAADRDVVRADVLELARSLGRAGLLEAVVAEPPPAPTASRPDGLPLGTPVPAWNLRDLAGREVASDDFAGRQYVLVNWSPSCGFCVRVASELAALTDALHAENIGLVLLASGNATTNRHLLEETGLACTVVLQDDLQVFRGLGTPCAYLVDADGRLASELAVGAGQVPALLRRVLGKS